MSDTRHVSLRDHLRVLRHYRIAVTVLTLLGAGIAAGLSFSREPSYVAKARVTFQEESRSNAEAARPAELLCIRADHTSRDEARAVKDALAHLPERTTGIVVTGLKPGREHDYGYYSHEYYGER